MTETYRARIDRATKRIVLPMPDGKNVMFSIAGVWGNLAEDGPDATIVELRCLTLKVERNGLYRLRHDVSFHLPYYTIGVEIEVLEAVPTTDLEVTLTPSNERRPEGRAPSWQATRAARG